MPKYDPNARESIAQVWDTDDVHLRRAGHNLDDESRDELRALADDARPRKAVATDMSATALRAYED